MEISNINACRKCSVGGDDDCIVFPLGDLSDQFSFISINPTMYKEYFPITLLIIIYLFVKYCTVSFYSTV